MVPGSVASAARGQRDHGVPERQRVDRNVRRLSNAYIHPQVVGYLVQRNCCVGAAVHNGDMLLHALI
jgi:hypothetical protein